MRKVEVTLDEARGAVYLAGTCRCGGAFIVREGIVAEVLQPGVDR